MNGEKLACTIQDDDDLRLAILGTDDEQKDASHALFMRYNEDVMRTLSSQHPGLDPHEKADVVVDAICEMIKIINLTPAKADGPLRAFLISIALNLGKSAWRKKAKIRKRETDELIEEVAEALEDTEIGNA